MILKEEYKKAKEIVEQFKKEEAVRQQKFEAGDIDLLKVVSVRSQNCLLSMFRFDEENQREEVFISDVVNYILSDRFHHNNTADRSYNALIKLKNLGRKSYEEIMSYVEPFL